jgi:fructose-bisphosphate aldolase class I
MFEETLYQSTADGRPFVDVLKAQGILPGIKVDTGLQVRGGGWRQQGVQRWGRQVEIG